VWLQAVPPQPVPEHGPVHRVEALLGRGDVGVFPKPIDESVRHEPGPFPDREGVWRLIEGVVRRRCLIEKWPSRPGGLSLSCPSRPHSTIPFVARLGGGVTGRRLAYRTLLQEQSPRRVVTAFGFLDAMLRSWSRPPIGNRSAPVRLGRECGGLGEILDLGYGE
jgi:hypothetical protein